MPMWDNFADQIGTLPTAPAVAATSDRLIYQRDGFSGAFSAVLTDVPFGLISMMNASGVNTAPTAATTPKDAFPLYVNAVALELVVTCTTSPATGTIPSFDFYNQTDAQSLVDGTATADAVLSIALSTNTVTDAAPDVTAIAAGEAIAFYCRQAATSAIGSTWGYLMYAK